MFALKRKSGHAQCSIRCSGFEMRTHLMVVTPPQKAFSDVCTPSHGYLVPTEQSTILGCLGLARRAAPD